MSLSFGHIYSDKSRREYGIERVLRMLILQFTEGEFDREMARLLKATMVSKWFHLFGLTKKTLNRSNFGVFRQPLGMEGLMVIFSKIAAVATSPV